MQKISIIGNSGSGKSTLAESIAHKCGLPRHVIDQYIWSDGWKQGNLDEFRSLHSGWVAGKNWVIDGVGPWDELVDRVGQSTHIIFYDLPVECCIERALARIEAEQNEPNRHIAAGCRYSEVLDLQLKVIHNYQDSYRPKLLKLFDSVDCELMIRTKPESIEQEFIEVLEYLGY